MAFLKKYKHLPNDVRLYQITPKGDVYLTGDGRIRHLDHTDPEISKNLLPFINPGNEAYYIIGESDTGPQKPSNATYKFGIMSPHHSFIPHLHGARHFVFCCGYGGCALYDQINNRVVPIYLVPGSLIEIPPLVSHAFFNRSNHPLVILVANTGLGIHHEAYATTIADAQRQKELTTDPGEQRMLNLSIAELSHIERFMCSVKPESRASIRTLANMLHVVGSWVDHVMN